MKAELHAQGIAIIEPVGGHGGLTPYDHGMAQALAAQGRAVTLYTCPETVPPEERRYVLDTCFRGVWGDRPKILRGVRYLVGLVQALGRARKKGEALVHFHFFAYGMLEWVTLKMARLFGRRIVVSAHDVEAFRGDFSPANVRLILGQADLVLAHSRVAMEELLERVGVERTQVRMVPLALDTAGSTDLPDADEARTRIDLPARVPIILFFGQIKPVKGLDLLIKAFPNILRRHPNARLVIAGRPWGEDYYRYEALLENLSVRDKSIERIGYIPEEHVMNYFSSCDVLVLPYRRIYQSAVVLTGMKYAVPIVATRIPGMQELIIDGVNGRLVAPEDPAALAEAINALLMDESERMRLAENGRAYCENEHGWAKVVEALGMCYDEVLHLG